MREIEQARANASEKNAPDSLEEPRRSFVGRSKEAARSVGAWWNMFVAVSCASGIVASAPFAFTGVRRAGY